MEKYFPADVSLRVEGDLAAAQSLFPAARQLLFRALRRQQLGGITNVNQAINGTDGSLVSVYLAGALKHVYVQPAPPKPGKPKPKDEPESVITEPVEIPFMVSGMVRARDPWIRPFVFTDAGNYYMAEFNPDATTVGVYGIDIGWQDLEKIAISVAGTPSPGYALCAYPKASMFSGKMKLLVQSGLGLARIPDLAQEEYISGVLPASEPDVNVAPRFDWTWLRTHGIYTTTEGECWQIEISKLNGVLAMPMPVFANTDTQSFRDWLQRVGDLGTVDVLDAFGGIPTCEPFPTGTTLADAITDGKVLQLLTDTDVLPFYRDTTLAIDKQPLYQDCGWAFSESGTRAINTCFYYKDIAKATTTPVPYPFTGFETYTDDERYMTAQYWRLDLTLSAINPEPTPSDPVGVGSAMLSMVSSQYLFGTYDGRYWSLLDVSRAPPPWYTNIGLWRPKTTSDSDGDQLENFTRFSYPWVNGGGSVQTDHENALFTTPVPILAFFDGEREEIVYQHPAPGAWIVPSYYQDLGFFGDSVNIDLTGYGFTKDANLICPKYVREGYILATARAFSSQSQTRAGGFFTGIGVVEFADDYGMDGVNDWWYDGVWNYGTEKIVHCGAIINAGPTGGYLMTDILHVETWPNVLHPNYTKRYIKTPFVASFDLMDDASTIDHGFVGAP